MTWLNTLLFTVVVPGTVTIYVPRWLLAAADFQPAFDPGAARYLGAVPIALRAAIYGWCAWDFTFTGKGTPAPIDPPKELVARGLYRYSRNPMYVGVLSVLLGESLWFTSEWLLAYAALVGLLFHFFVTLYEEPNLRHQFGATYEQYCQKVPRWIGRRKR